MIKINRKQSGIALIMVLLIMVFLTMFSTVALALTINQQHRTKVMYQRQMALKTADSAVQYAMSRLCRYPGWRGCELPGSDKHIFRQDGIDVYEHHVSGNEGWVEGKVHMGHSVGYFDIYFHRPPGGAAGQFFAPDKEAGPLPSNATLSSNNTLWAGLGTSKISARDFQNAIVPGKVVPKQAIFIVARGRVNNIEQVVEACVRFDLMNGGRSVVIGRDDVTLNLKRQDTDTNKIILSSGDDDLPAFIRSAGSLAINVVDSLNDNDYLDARNDSGGASEDGISFGTLAPLSGANNFVQEPDQERFLPKLTLTDVLPPSGTYQFSLKAGSYVLKADDSGYPQVLYYERNSIDDVDLSAESDDNLTDEFKQLIDNGSLAWDRELCKLTIKKSCNVTSAGSMNNLNFISPKPDAQALTRRITVELGGTSVSGGNSIIYLTNENQGGNISVNGQLSGIGTVICRGDLEMQAESQLFCNELNGLSIYAGGDVTIHEPDQEPLIPGVTVGVPGPGNPPATGGSNNGGTNPPGGGTIPTGPQAPLDPNDALASALLRVRQAYLDNQDKPQIFFTSDNFLPAEWAALTGQFTPTGPNNNTVIGLNLAHENPQDLMVDGWNVRCYPYKSSGYDQYGNPISGNAMNFQSIMEKCGIEPMANDSPQSSPTPTASPDDNGTGGPPSPPPALNIPVKYDEKGRRIQLRDSIFYGLVYACGDFNVESGDHAFSLRGGMVAFGGNSDGVPGSGGSVTINSSDCQLLYDAQRMGYFIPEQPSLELIFWNSYTP